MKIVICNERASSVRFPISDVSVAHIVICLFSILFVFYFRSFLFQFHSALRMFLAFCSSFASGGSVMAESAHSAIKNVILIRITSRHKKHACSCSFFSCGFYGIVLKDENKKVKEKRSNTSLFEIIKRER
jgi:zinc transporter ZupT